MKSAGIPAAKRVDESEPGWLRATAVYALANVANSAIPFLLLPVLTRILTPHDYGVVVISSTLLGVFSAFAGLSVHGAVNMRFFDRDVRHPRYVGSALAILGGSTAVTLLAALIAAPFVTAWTGLSIGWLALAVLAAGAQFVINVRLIMWQVRGQALQYGSFQVAQTVLNLGLSVFLVAVIGLGWEGRVAGILVAVICFAAIALASLHGSSLVEWRPQREYVRDALRFGVPLIPHAIGSLLIAASDRLMIAGLMSVGDAGIYAAAMQVGLVVAVLADAAVKAFTPWLYERLSRQDKGVQRTIVRVTYAYFGAIAAVALAFGAASPYLLLLVGESFRATHEVVFYVALGAAFGGMYLVVVSYVFYARRNEWLSAASVGVGVFNVLSTYLLIGRNGAVGAAQAYALSQFTLFVIVWIIAAKCYPMPWGGALRIAPRPASALSTGEH